VAIDAGMDSDGRDFLDAVKTLNRSAADVRAVLLTHWHNDHAAGAAAMREKLGARIYYAAADAPFMTRGTARRGIRSWLSDRLPEEGLLVLLKGLLEEAPPRAVAASHHVEDGERIEGSFIAIASAGHTPGHVAYFHVPSRALFCGDALAVVNDRLRLLSRPVTPDRVAARASAIHCLKTSPALICPGHRAPLTANVPSEVERMRKFLVESHDWPLFG
jgi:glyoxylase-like metal-dependent hydrolase (beta-lactamase superfamily II)